MTDISSTIEPDSTQLNATDFLAGERTYTVESTQVTGGDQPVNIFLAEVDGRAYRPSKSMRRVLAACWGPDSAAWTGRRLTLYCDPNVKWAGKAVGGIKISAVSHIDKQVQVPLQESSTVRTMHKVQPLKSSPAPAPTPTEPTAEEVAACTSVDDLRAMWNAAGPERQAQIKARVEELQATDTTVPDDALPIEEAGV